MPSASRTSVRGVGLGTGHLVFLLLLAATLGQLAWYYPALPMRMASHFDIMGRADAFMPKDDFVKVQLGAVGLLSLMFLLVPVLIVRLPAGMINLPNKDYWLAPERRAQTARVIQGHLVGFGNAMLLALFVVFGDVMRASRMPVPRLSHRVWVMLILLAVFLIVWTVRFVRAFRMPD
jgi:uncharacterized membrane protein